MDIFLPIWHPFIHFLTQAIMGIHDWLMDAGIPGASGLSIILFTLILRALTVPLYMQQLKSQKVMMQLQPEVQALQRKYGKDREKLMQEQMKLYRQFGYNPVSGCLPMLLQMPIWFGLYAALIELNLTEQFNTPFLWLPSLAQHDPFYVLPVLTVATQWVVQKMMTMPTADPQQQQMNQVMQFMPLMFGFFALQVPAGLVLYWVVSNLFTMIQQYFVMGWGGLKPGAGGVGGTGTGAGASPAGEPPAVGPGGGRRRADRADDEANGREAAATADSGTITGLKPEEITATATRGGIRTYTLAPSRDGDLSAAEAPAAEPSRRRNRKRQR